MKAGVTTGVAATLIGVAATQWLYIYWPVGVVAIIAAAVANVFLMIHYTRAIVKVTADVLAAELEEKAVRSLARWTVEQVVSKAPYN